MYSLLIRNKTSGDKDIDNTDEVIVLQTQKKHPFKQGNSLLQYLAEGPAENHEENLKFQLHETSTPVRENACSKRKLLKANNRKRMANEIASLLTLLFVILPWTSSAFNVLHVRNPYPEI